MRKCFSCKSRLKVGKILAFALFLNMNLGWVGTLSSESSDSKVITRAPRGDASSDVFVACCSSSSELDSISQCICFVRGLLDTVDSKIDVIDSKIDALDTGFEVLESKIDVIDDNVGASDDVIDGSITEALVLDVNATTTLSVIQWLKVIYDKVK